MDRYTPDPVVTLSADDADRQRHEARDSLFLIAKLAVAGMPGEQVRVRNLSAGGLMAEYPAPVATGTIVTIDLRGVGCISGRVAWVMDGRLGIAFDRQIDPLMARKPVTTKPSTRR